MCMAVLRAIARPMLASIFIAEGVDKLRRPEQVAPVAEPVVKPLAETVPGVPDETEQAVRINGAVQLTAGLLLALGWWPRLAALALAGTLVPTTAAGHRFWEAPGKQERSEQRIHFLKNASMFGGLLIAAADTGGKPSLAWRSRYAAKSARRDLARTARTAKTSGKAGARAGRIAKTSGNAGARAGRLAKTSGKAGARTARLAKTSGKAGARTARMAKTSGKAGARAGRVSRRLPGR